MKMIVIKPLYAVAFLSVLLGFSCGKRPLTAERIVARCAEAMGGMDNIQKIKTIRIHAVYPDHGDHPLILEIRRPNLSFNPQANLVFDGKRLCFLNGSDHKSGPELVDPEEWKDGDTDIAYNFPAFFDYAAEYLGTDTIDRRTFHKLLVALPLGAEMTYWIDAQTFLPVKAAARSIMYGKEFNSRRDYSDFRETGGVFLPYGFTYGSRYGQIQGKVESIDINPVFPEDHFRIPIE